MGRAAKRQRMKKTEDVADTKKAVLLITCLPFELIAEVLLYSKSPADPLSLSRTCRHFQATLVQNPVAAFIWKSIRAQTTPPVPDPTKLGFSEPELANFIYGEGRCTVIFLMPHFALPALIFCSRNVEDVQTICTRRFPPGYASVGIRSVIGNIRQSAISPAVSLNSRPSKGELCSVLFYPLTRIVVALDRMAKDRQRYGAFVHIMI